MYLEEAYKLTLVRVRIAAVNVVGSVSSMEIVSGSVTARYIGQKNLRKPRTMEPWRQSEECLYIP